MYASPLTVFRAITVQGVQPVPLAAEASSHDFETHLRRLGAYTRLDGPGSALRKARTRHGRIGQFGSLARVTFSCHEIANDRGETFAGEWTGSGVGELSTSRGLADFISWNFELSVDRPLEEMHRSTLVGRQARSVDAPRVGVIGAGAFVYNVVIPALRKAGAHVAVVSDASPVRARRCARRLGVPEVLPYPSAMSAFANSRGLDGVVLACAHSAHAPLAMRLASQGLPMLVEKPVALSPAALKALLDLPGRSPIWVGHNRREAPSFSRLVEHLHEPWHLDTTVESFPLHDYHWYRAPGQGGRHLGNLTHWIDLAVALAGASPEESVVRRLAGEGLELGLQFPGRSSATIRLLEVGNRLVGGREVIRLATPLGTVTIDDWGAKTHVETATSSRRKVGLRDRGHASEYGMWVGQLRRGPFDRLREAVPAHSIAFSCADSLARVGAVDSSI